MACIDSRMLSTQGFALQCFSVKIVLLACCVFGALSSLLHRLKHSEGVNDCVISLLRFALRSSHHVGAIVHVQVSICTNILEHRCFTTSVF